MSDFSTQIGIRLTMQGVSALRGDVRAVQAQVDSLGGSLRDMGRMATAAFGALGVGLSVREFVQAADSVTVLRNQLKLATSSTEEARTAYEQLHQIAQRSAVSFTDLGSTYASISRSTQELGLSQQDLLTVTESIANAMRITGGPAESMNAALIQLGQGFASGTLRGEELNSVMEQAPRLAQAIANGMGITIGQLREYGKQGKITAGEVVAALKSQSEVLQREVQTSELTVGQAMTQIRNATIKTVGEFNTATGATSTLAGAMQTLASAVTTVGDVIRNNETAFSVIGSTLAGAAVAGGVALLASRIGVLAGAVGTLGAVLAANPAVLAFLGIGAAAGGLVAVGKAWSKTEDGIRAAMEGLQAEIEMSEKALQRAVDRGATAGAENIRQKIASNREEIASLRKELEALNTAATAGATGAGGGRGSVNPTTVGGLFKQQQEQEAALRKSYDDIIGKSTKGTRQDPEYTRQLGQLNDALKAGVINADEFRKAKEALDASFSKGQAKAAASTVGEALRLQEQQEKAALRYVQRLQEQAAGVEKLTTYERLLYDMRTGSVTFASQQDFQDAAAAAQMIDSAKNAADAQERLNELYREGTSLAESLRNPQETLSAQMERYRQLLDAGAISQETFNRAVQAAEKAYASSSENITELDRFTAQFAENTQQQLGDGLYQALTGNFENIGDSFKNMLVRMYADAVAADLARAMFGSSTESGTRSGGFLSGLVGTIGSIFGGGRANGGPTAAGKIYQVNERGTPEMLSVGNKDYLLMGGMSGYVTPASTAMQSAGGVAVSSTAAPTVIINNYSGNEIQQRQGSGGELVLDVLARQVEGFMGQRAAQGQGPLVQGLKGRFNMQERR